MTSSSPDPAPQSSAVAARPPRFWRHVLVGFLTLAPLWVTWLVFDFAFGLLARSGEPLLRAVARALQPWSPLASEWLLTSFVQTALAVLTTLTGLYLVGLATSFVLGRRLIAWFERLITRLPLVQTIYNATKRFLQTLSKPPVGQQQRVVLISFPSPEMKTVGFVTKTFQDPDTGRQLVAVYVPTAPNPTSGYIEIVPLDDVVPTGWSMEEAMAFVITGGTTAPDVLRFERPHPPPEGSAP